MRKYIEKNPGGFMMWSILGLSLFMLPSMFRATNSMEERIEHIAQDCVNKGGQWVHNTSIVISSYR